MTAPKDQLNVKKIVLIIAVVTGVVVLALATYRDATRQHLPVPLQTPLPDPDDSTEAHPEDKEEPAIDLAEPSQNSDPETIEQDEMGLESEDTNSSQTLDIDSDEINADADR